MPAKNTGCKHTLLYASAYVDGSKNSSGISSSNGYRYALIVVTGVFDVLDTLQILIKNSFDTQYNHTLGTQVSVAPGVAGSVSKSFLLDKSLIRKNTRVRIVGAGDNTVDANTRPAVTINCFEFDSKDRGEVQADYYINENDVSSIP